MNRSAPLRRYQPLQARTGLRPGSPLQRTAALGRSVPLAPVSPARRAENRRRKAIASSHWGPDERPLCAWPGPSHWADAFHEILTRARGGSPVDEDNMLPMCNLHNGMLSQLTGSELTRAEHAGLLKHSWQGAA